MIARLIGRPKNIAARSSVAAPIVQAGHAAQGHRPVPLTVSDRCAGHGVPTSERAELLARGGDSPP